MCNVNYLIEIRRFNTFAARTRLPASAQLLWYKLIEIMNQHAAAATGATASSASTTRTCSPTFP